MRKYNNTNGTAQSLNYGSKSVGIRVAIYSMSIKLVSTSVEVIWVKCQANLTGVGQFDSHPYRGREGRQHTPGNVIC